MNDSKKVDVLNFLLIWITLAISYSIPFELFLFSYAVLGPLHYLTEINWLEKKNYFLKNKTDKKIYLIAVIVLISITTVTLLITEMEKWEFSKQFHQYIFQSPISLPLATFIKWSYSAIFIGFLFSIIYFITERWKNRILLACISIITTILFFRFPLFTIWFGTFLPTIIHVFLFTTLFMWSGAKRSKSGWGYLNVISMFIVILVIINKKIIINSDSVNYTAIETLITSNFHHVNFIINKLLGTTAGNEWDVLSPNVWKVQVFITFAYTYHYLNWFSKTTVINWHKVDRKKMKITFVFWIVSVSLFYINYRIGFAALFVLSMLHVILEFPLNVNTAVSIIQPTKDK